jgi:phosphatidylserine decarboxylase
MTLLERLFTSGGFQRLINRKGLSAFLGRFASKELPKWILQPVIKLFIRVEGVNMNEYHKDLDDYKTFNEFFTRKLIPGARVFEDGICSPVDGFVSEIGPIKDGQLLQVKGKYYSLNDLVGDYFAFMNGCFATIYLSPADYHRIHAPFDMQIEEVNYLPGDLYSVNDASVTKIDQLFCKNERVILRGNSSYGKFYFVLVGAIVVGKIKLSFLEDIKPGDTKVDVKLEKGEELGLFELGSTIIMALDTEALNECALKNGDKVRMGTRLV